MLRADAMVAPERMPLPVLTALGLVLSEQYVKVVFVDFDGVLNSTAYFEAKPTVAADSQKSGSDWWTADSLDPTAIARLNTIVTTTHAVVVLSTSWRKLHTLDALCDLLRARGFAGKVIGKTPTLYRTPDGHRRSRGDEIQLWLDEHATVSAFVILEDDESLGSLEARCVRTDPAVGLTDADAQRAISLLSGP